MKSQCSEFFTITIRLCWRCKDRDLRCQWSIKTNNYFNFTMIYAILKIILLHYYDNNISKASKSNFRKNPTACLWTKNKYKEFSVIDPTKIRVDITKFPGNLSGNFLKCAFKPPTYWWNRTTSFLVKKQNLRHRQIYEPV